MGHHVTIRREPARHLAVVHFDARPEEMAAKQGRAFAQVAGYLDRSGLAVSGPAMSCYGMGEGTFHVSSGFVVDGPVTPGEGVEPLLLPEAEVVTTTHLGPYEQLGQAYDALQEAARAEGREVDESGLMWEEYWTGPEVAPEQQKTVVYWPLRRVGEDV